MNENRHNEMVGVQLKTQKEFEKFRVFCASSLNRFTTQGGEPSFLYSLLEKRMYGRTPVLKAYFTRKIYDYLAWPAMDESSNELFGQVLPFFMETAMTIQYYDNQILDRKGGVINAELINNNLILNNLLRECLWEYLEASLPPREFTIVNKHLRLILRMVDVGQLTEKKNNLFPNYLNNVYDIEWNERVLMHLDQKVIADIKGIILCIAPELENGTAFLDWYLKRIFFSGAFIYPETTRMILKLIEKEDQDHYKLLHFSSLYGMMMQIVNDITDLVPSAVTKHSVVKRRTDAFSDLKTKNVTLPFLIHLENQEGGFVREKFEQVGFELTGKDELEVLKELFSTSSIEKTQTIGKRLAHEARSFLDEANPNTGHFKDMCNIANFNQPYKQLAEIKRGLG